MITTKLSLRDKLPLTCSRLGTCCHGNLVHLNPWELACLADAKKMTPREFHDEYCDLGGIRLKFNGKIDSRGKQACSQYIPDFGCSVHSGRPLACRLFPLGRQIQNEEAHYMHQGSEFPCLNGCSIVTELPYLSVEEYLGGQKTSSFEQAQDAYLEVMQNLADVALTLLLDTGLAASGDTRTLSTWRVLGNESQEEIMKRIPQDWLGCLTLPEIIAELNNPVAFAEKHNEILQSKAQAQFESLTTFDEVYEATILIMAVTLHLASAIGADSKSLIEHWIGIARENGALG